MWKRWVCVVVWTDGGFQKRWRSIAMTLPWHCHKLALETEKLIKRMAGEMQMRISLYIVLIYRQKQLDILSQTYSLLQRRRRALYLMFLSDSKKKRKTTVQTVAYFERRFWTRPGRKMIRGTDIQGYRPAQGYRLSQLSTDHVYNGLLQFFSKVVDIYYI